MPSRAPFPSSFPDCRTSSTFEFPFGRAKAARQRASSMPWGVERLIGLNTTLCRNADILHAPVGAEEAVMMSIEAGRYYGVNAVGARIWELLATPHTIEQLCAQICEEFDVATHTCETAVLDFTLNLAANGIAPASGLEASNFSTVGRPRPLAPP